MQHGCVVKRAESGLSYANVDPERGSQTHSSERKFSTESPVVDVPTFFCNVDTDKTHGFGWEVPISATSSTLDPPAQ